MSAPTFTQHAARSSSKTNGDGHAGDRGSDGEPLPLARAAKVVPAADVPPSGSLSFIEQVYDAYQEDPTSVSPDWREYFESLAAAGKTPLEQHPEDVFPRRSIFHHTTAAKTETPDESTRRQMKEVASLQERVDQIIRNYRVRGHIIAQVDPLHQPKEMPAELDPAFYGFIDGDLDRKFSTSWLGGPERRTLRQIISWLQNTYCRSIGAQFMHIDSLRVRQWLQDRMEGSGNYLKLPRDEQLRIYKRLSDAVMFEEFIQKKYISKKRFSLEGAESLIPLLDMAIEKAGTQGVDEIVLGMAHRGRLNVLANVMGKPPQPDLPRVRRRRSRSARRRRRREVPPGLQQRLENAVGQRRPPVAVLQPEPPGVRQPDRDGPHARQAGSRERLRPQAQADVADPRRRGVRRRRDHPGNAEPESARSAIAPAARCTSS